MSDSLADALSWSGQEGVEKATDAETTPRGSESPRWVVVADGLNPAEAAIIKGRLVSEGITAIVRQEAVGVVLGLTVGPLGSAQVLVPEPLARQALEVLNDTFEVGGEVY
ncbi:MAG: DUF2007 domain-containing protein [Anaerolineae bacterium]|nr:DUF2007 domain-containing protein [Anaerolineae bacterium]